MKEKDIPNVLELTKEQISDKMGDMTLTIKLNEDGTTETTPPAPSGKSRSIKGTWKVASEDGMVVKLETEERGKSDTPTLTFRSDDEYEFASDADKFKQMPFKMPLVFKRQ